MSYIGSTPTTQSFIAGTDYFNGDGSTTAFTLSRSVVSTNDIQATVNNVVQQPNTAYTVSGTTITFTSAPSAGTANIYVRYLSTTTQSITPSQGTVGNNQFANNISAIPMTYGILGAGNASIMKNRLINGAMVIDQRNAGASYTIPSGTNYLLDRWQTYCTNASKLSMQQNAGSVTPPSGYTNYLGLTSLAATTLGAGDEYFIDQIIEGFNVADLGWGAANAKTVTLSFQVYSSLTGSFGGSLSNSNQSRCYPFSYTISSANTWTQISITVAGDITGTWAKDNTRGLRVMFGLGVGTTYGSGTAGAWTSASSTDVPTGSVSVVGTNGATFYITGVQLEVGSSATGFEYVNYQTSLANCQRYFETTFGTGVAVGTGSAPATFRGSTTVYGPNSYFGTLIFKVSKRADPTINFWDGGTSGNLSCYTTSSASSLVGIAQNITTTGCSGNIAAVTNLTFVQGNWTASAEL